MNISDLINIQAYVINMPDKEDNYIRARSELCKHGFKNVNRFVSFDSQNEDLLIKKSCELGLTKFHGSNSQQSLSLAHFNILKILIDSNEESILIFEDDIVFHSEFNSLIESKIKNIQIENLDLLFLGSWVVNNKVTDIDFVEKKHGILHAHAYLIKKKAAIKVLNHCRSVGYRAVDQVYNSTMSGQLTQIAIIQSPKSSNNTDKVRTKEEEMTGLVYQLKHPSYVINNNRIDKQWSCR